MNPYEKLLKRKRTWTPVQTTKGNFKSGAEETIYRALAIRHMELPVGDFISGALSEIPEKSRELLESNIKGKRCSRLAEMRAAGLVAAVRLNSFDGDLDLEGLFG